MKRPFIFTALALSAGTLAVVAVAGPGRGHGGPMSADEAQARQAAMIAEADVDGNGGVSLDEFRLPHGKRAEQRRERQERHADNLPELFARLDADNNGSLSAAEFEALPATGRELAREKMFTHLDTDGDGLLTTADTSPMEARLARMDTDRDGHVSRAERRAAREAMREQHGQF